MWQPVIGLEVHVQLATVSKIFSGASTTFGANPNTQACAVDLGLPGVLPVINSKAVDMALKFGLAIHAAIPEQSVFARKNYFYPDLPKGYQISQYAEPIVGPGYVTIGSGQSQKKIGITRAHLEEDAGKSLHDQFSGLTAIDLNRAGMPLLEIVSEPELFSAQEAVAYLKVIHALITYLDISDGNMAEGSMRCDVNISLRPAGSTALGTRTEIKNVNSFRFVEKAIAHEIERQSDILDSGGKITQETRLYDPDRDQTRPMRGKEEANDYRYFPDPDLLPIKITAEKLSSIRSTLPELPEAKSQRFQTELGLSDYDAALLTEQKALADYFETALLCVPTAPKTLCNWMTSELLGALNRENLTVSQCAISPEHMGKLVARIEDKTLSSKTAKAVFNHLWLKDQDPDLIIANEGLKQVTDTGFIDTIVAQVIDAHPDQTAAYRASDEKKRKKLLGFFVGQVMKHSQGKANPQQVNSALIQALEGN